MVKKQQKRSREDMHQEEASAKHSSLVATSTKKFRREAKVVKAHECQKIVRKIKTLRASISGDDEGDSEGGVDKDPQDTKMMAELQSLNEKLCYTKAFSIDEVANICIRRVGLESVKEGEKSNDIAKGLNRENDDEDGADKKFKKNLVETMLRHKRLSSAIQSVSEKVSEYNSWLSRREDWLMGRSSGRAPRHKNENNLQKKRGAKRGRDEQEFQGGSNLFIGSLNDSALPIEQEEVEEYDGIGYGMRNEYEQFPVEKKKKKNRQGQRARKIKAMAIEARKAGRVWDPSINWREKKSKPKENEQNHKNESASGLDKFKEIKAAEVASMGKSWKEEGKAHPSWAAREAQKAKSGIAAFAGKKITFD